MARSSFVLAFFLVVGCGSSVAEPTDAGADGTDDASSDVTADIKPDTKPDAVGDATCTCLDAQLGWEMNGGLVAYYDSMSLTGCNDYARRRFEPGATAPKLECTTKFRNCLGDYTDTDDTWSVQDVNARLADPDVRAALAAAPVLYGKDPRAYDGAVFQVKIDGKTIEIGVDCGTTPGCKPVPKGVAALRERLMDIDAQKTVVVCSSFK